MSEPGIHISGSRALPRTQRWLLRLLKSATIIYLGALVVLVLLETLLVHPAPRAHRGDWSPQGLDFEDVHLESADGTALHGWFVPSPNPVQSILLLHGNGENVAMMAEEMKLVRDSFQANVMALDYRGYGKSEGRPHEAGVLADGEAAQQWLAKRVGEAPENLVIWGRSLGGGVGVHLAATQGAKALILDRTFSSLAETGASHFPWLPVRRLMRNRYPSTERIQNYCGPLFQVHGHPDRIIPFRLGKQLFEASPSIEKRFLESPNLHHNDRWPPEFYVELSRFLAER